MNENMHVHTFHTMSTMERNRIKFVINKFILRIVILLLFLFIGLVNFAHASECKKEDKKTILEHIKGSPSPYILKGLSPCFKKDKEIALEVVQVYGLGLQYVDESLKKDKDVVLQAVQTAGMALKFAHETLKNDRDIVLTAVTSNGHALLYASQYLKKDKQIVLRAVKNNGLSYQYIDESLKDDKDIALVAFKTSGRMLKYANESLKKDREIVYEAVKHDGLALEYADNSLKKDKEVVLKAVKAYGLAFKYADLSLKNNKEIMLAAIKKNLDNIIYIGESLKNDKQFILQAIKIDHRVLGRVVGQAFNKDKDLVLNAVINNGVAFKYANHNLKKDKGFVLKVVKIEGRAISFADDLLKKDKEVVLAAVKENGFALSIVDESLKKDKEVVLEAVKNDSRAFEYADESLKKDDDILFAAQAKEFTNDTDEIGTPYIKPKGWKIKSSHTIFSSDQKRMYTIFKGQLYIFQHKPFKLLQVHNVPFHKTSFRGFDMFLSSDEKHLILTIPNKIILYNLARQKIDRSTEIKDYELIDSVLNGDELVVYTKYTSLGAYQRKYPDAGRPDLATQLGNIHIYDAYSLKLKSNTELHDNGYPHGSFAERLNRVGDYISVRRGQSDYDNLILLDTKTYKPRFEFVMIQSDSIKISPDLQHISLPNIVEPNNFYPNPNYVINDDGTKSLFSKKFNKAWFSLKDKQFLDPKTSPERVNNLEQSAFLFSSASLQMLEAGDYISSHGSRIYDIKTKQVFLLYLFDNKQAVFIERTTGHFAMTKHARKHLTMKTKSGYIVPINDATFNQFNLKE